MDCQAAGISIPPVAWTFDWPLGGSAGSRDGIESVGFGIPSGRRFPSGTFLAVSIDRSGAAVQDVTEIVTGHNRIVIRGFLPKGLERFFQSGSKSGIQPQHGESLRITLGRLKASTSRQDMGLPGLFLHELGRDRKGTWSVRVSGDWLVTFRFVGADADAVDYEDDH